MGIHMAWKFFPNEIAMSSNREGVPMQRPCLNRIKRTQKYTFCEGTKRLALEHLLLCNNNMRELHVRIMLCMKLQISHCFFLKPWVPVSLPGGFEGL